MVENKHFLCEKSFRFSVRIINMYKHLSDSKKEFILSKQVLRSGTSIGANIEEATSASSKRDLINKYHISLKEAKETKYWLKLLHETEFIEKESFISILSDCNELISLLTKSIKSAKESLSKEKV